MALRAFALNCTLKSGDTPSSTDAMIGVVLSALAERGVGGDSARVANHAVKPGVTSDEGEGDAWPALRRRILEADIFLLATPIWLGQPSSIAKRVLERLDAFLSETDERGRMPAYGKVALAAVVGNEDGAHHCHAELYQALADVGFSIPPNAGVYWVGEAMGSTDFKDLDETPEKVLSAAAAAASNAAHLAELLKRSGYPGVAS